MCSTPRGLVGVVVVGVTLGLLNIVWENYSGKLDVLERLGTEPLVQWVFGDFWISILTGIKDLESELSGCYHKNE